MPREKLIRILCIALVTTVLALALILVVAVAGGMLASPSVPDEGDGDFDPSFPQGTFDFGDILESLDPDDFTREPHGTLPPEPEITLPEWESDFEWPTLPPTLETDPDFELPTLPEGWDTLPPEWDTLPPEWGDALDGLPIEPDDLADLLAGMNGELGLPPGALAAGVASQLTVMEIYAERDDRLYLMMQAFGDYTGQGWSEAAAYPGMVYDHGGVYCYPHHHMDALTPFVGYPLQITPKMEAHVLPYYLTTHGIDQLKLINDVKAEGDGTLPYTVYYRPYSTYAGADRVDQLFATHELAYTAYVMDRYLALDSTTASYMKLIIEREGFDKNDPDIIQKVAAYIQNSATYDLAYDQNLDREPNVALAFLGAYKEGVCRHFATAATLLYRALGIPARYTVGFMTDVKAGETTAVKGMDAHAWVEVYVEGFGWQYVEVTGFPAEDGPTEPGTGTGTGTGTTPGTGGDSTEPPVEPEDPTTWGDLMAGTNGRFTLSPSIPPALLSSTVFKLQNEIPDRVLLKLKSFGSYTGQGFADAPYCDFSIYNTCSSAYLPGCYLMPRTETHRTLQIESLMGTYAAPYYLSVYDLIPGANGLTVTDSRVTGDGRRVYSVNYYPEDPDYEPKTTDDRYGESKLAEFAYRHYTEVDDETAAYLNPLVEWLGEFPSTVAIEWVAAYLRDNYTLDDDYDTALDSEANVVVSYLRDYKTGTARHMAAAATLLYRMVGIPARYTVGYLAETTTDTTRVLGSDAYAWVEIYVEGFGWAPVDVVGRNAEAVEQYTVTVKPVDMVAQYTGSPIEHNGLLTGLEAFEAKGYTYTAFVNGKRTACGRSVAILQKLTIYDPSGQDVTHLFTVESTPGSLTVYLAELTFGSTSQSKTYDGTPLTTADALFLSGTLPQGYMIEIIRTGSRTTVGTGYAAFDIKIWYHGGTGAREDRTSHFLISKVYGTLTVTPAPLTIKAADAEKVFDGEALTTDAYELIGELAPGDTIESVTVEGSQTRVGRSENLITGIIIRNSDGEDVTLCYAIETLPGTLRVVSP